MSLQRRSDDGDPFRPVPVGGQHELRHDDRDGVLATATLACPRCDAPVSPPHRMAITEPLGCPFCGTWGPVREFLSLDVPARPARVVVRVAAQPVRLRGR